MTFHTSAKLVPMVFLDPQRFVLDKQGQDSASPASTSPFDQEQCSQCGSETLQLTRSTTIMLVGHAPIPSSNPVATNG